MTDTTATSLLIEQQNERAVHDRMEHFIRKWSPNDRHRSEFSADLYMLMRVVHIDAARPYETMMRNIMMAAPYPFPTLLKKEPQE